MSDFLERLEIRRHLAAQVNDDSFPSNLTPVGTTTFFTADDGVHGEEPWKTDGTSAGTMLVKDIVAGGVGSKPRDLLTLDNTTVYFWTQNEFQDPQLWKSDGTAGGTQLVRDLRTEAGHAITMNKMMAGNGKLFIAVNVGQSHDLLIVSDGTEAGTNVIGDFNGGAFTLLAPAAGVMFFDAVDATHGYELWKSDGTSAGTAIVKDINPGFASSGKGGSVGGDVAVFNNELYFGADTPSGEQVWKSDGSAGGTVMVADQPVEGDWTVFQNSLYFVNGNGLWKTDGTPAGTTMVSSKTVTLGPQPVVVGQAMYFGGYEPTHGNELWKTDGTDAGTVLVKDISPGTGSSAPRSLTNFNGTLYFAASGELWKSDGTAAGTVQVSNFASSSSPTGKGQISEPLTVSNGLLLFDVADDAIGYELWKSDGTSAGTALVKDINTTAVSFIVTAHRNGGLTYDTILGTSGDDVFTLARSGDFFVVTRNGKAMVLDPVFAGLDQVEIDMLDGNDSLDASTYPFELIIQAGEGNDVVTSGAGNDTIAGVGGNDTISGGGGRDEIAGGDGKDHLYGNGGNDTITGGAQSDFIRGTGGHDRIYGNGGNDTLFGGASGDSLYGQAGNDQLFGEGGNDHLYGDDGFSDTLSGGAGDDVLITLDGAVDHLSGDGGHDSANADPSDILTSIEGST